MNGRVGFVHRLGALVVDSVLLALFFSVVIGVLRAVGTPGANFELLSYFFLHPFQHGAGAVLINSPGGTVMFLIYTLYFSSEILFEGSPGKRLLGLRICEEDGRKGSKAALLMRYFAKHIAVLGAFFGAVLGIPLFGLLGSVGGGLILLGLLLVFLEGAQTAHDRIAATAVYFGTGVEEGGEAHDKVLLIRAPARKALEGIVFK